MKFKAVVLAAGLGTRMKSDLPKVMHPVLGRPMVAWPVDLALDAGAEEVAVVVGYRRELVESYLSERYPEAPVTFHVQREMNGTADAVRSASAAFAGYDGAVMILYGDVPNLPADAIRGIVELHRSSDALVTMLTAHDPTPNQYGRIVRDGTHARRIVEFADAGEAERALTEVNIGVYLVDARFLRDGLARLDSDNAQGEFYLTDLVEMAWDAGRPTEVVVGDEIEPLHGVNDRVQLARANAWARRRTAEAAMLSGSWIPDVSSTWMDADVVLGRGTTIEPHVTLRGATRIGENATVESFCRLESVVVAPGVRVPAGTTQTGGRIDH